MGADTPIGGRWPLELEDEHERAGLAWFLATEGVNDWVVVHGGATAVFRVGSLTEAAHLAEAVAKAPGIAGVGVRC
jgi:4a-hydroxytetrahydrobiopterin dehydratase